MDNDVGHCKQVPRNKIDIDINEAISEWNLINCQFMNPDWIKLSKARKEPFFSTNIEEAIVDADIIFISVTPENVWSWCQSGS